MGFLSNRRRRDQEDVQDPDVELDEDTDADADQPGGSGRGWFAGARATAARARGTAGPWPSKGAVASKSFLALALAAMACGPAALALAATGSNTTPVATSTPAAGSEEQARTTVESVSVQLVHALLTADRDHADHLKDLVAEPPGQLDLPAKAGQPPTSITVDTLTRGRAHRWTATLTSLGGQSGDGQTWQVTIDYNPATGRARAVRLPAQIATPNPQKVPVTTTTSVSMNDPAAVAGAGYITALLTGATDLSRWTSPGSSATAISPAACSKVTAETAETTGTGDPPTPGDGQHLDLVISVTCTLPGSDNQADNARSLQYPLTLASRGGRWEVAATTPTTAPSASPTTTPSDTPS